MSKKLVLTINIRTYAADVLETDSTKIIMIPFDGEAGGEYFHGKTVGKSVDTQIVRGENFSLSARYMLEGTDFNGEKCKVFIENNGVSMDKCVPTIYTDSKVLSFLENTKLSSVVKGVENGVIVKIYAKI